jgi:thermopsin
MVRRFLSLSALLVLVGTIALMMPTAAAAPTTAGAVLPPSTVAPAPHAVAAPMAASPEAKTLGAIAAAHVPLKYAFLPNYHPAVSAGNGIVQPLYGVAPAPMGLGYFGLQQGKNGGTTGTISYTNSVEAAVTLNSVNPFYLASSSPDIFTMQLNTVMVHTTVLGNTSGVYWIQNVPVYYAQSHTLTFEDNIWNFSTAGAGMYTSTLYSYDGTVVQPTFYYALGPTFANMVEPFTVKLYNNVSVYNDRPTVWFNYSITAANGSVYAGSYDQVEFNSAVNPTSPAAPAPFQINGKQTNALGLLNDAEIMLGGPGGGSTTSLFGISGSMQLWTLANGSTTYAPVPAGYDFGTDTGETSEGIAEYASGSMANPSAVLNPGPSLLMPLWGLPHTSFGGVKQTIKVAPSNAFIFASPGTTFRPDHAAWAPTPVSGTMTTMLPAGTYTYRVLLSDYRSTERTLTNSTSNTVNLVYDAARGVYTPLWAWDASQLAGISSSGSGTLANPYVLENNGVGIMDPLFGEFNDYVYPVFPGIFIANTHVHVSVERQVAFQVDYTMPAEQGAVQFFGLPASNNLGMQFYNDDYVAVVGNPVITGWFFSQSDSYMSNLLFWNSSDCLVAGNTFQVQTQAIILSGGTNNVLFGNVMQPATSTAKNPTTVYAFGTILGIVEYESGDLIYNNYVTTPVTAYTPAINLYTGAPQYNIDRWNVSKTPASNVVYKDGWALTGNILGLSWMGGNFWGNYGTAQNPYGVLPYNDGGLIFFGGDYLPLLPYPLYKVTFSETGFNPTGGAWWTVTMNGYTQATNGSSLTFWLPAGTWAYTVTDSNGQHVNHAAGAIPNLGGWYTVHLKFR